MENNQESKNPILEKINDYAGVTSGTASTVIGVATGDPMLAIGGAVTFFSSFITPFMKKNRDKFLDDLKEDLEKLERKLGLKIETVLNNEKVLSAILEAYPTAVREFREMKRELLRNAILNIARDVAIEDDLRSMYFRFIDELTPTHIKILEYFKSPKEWLQKFNIRYDDVMSTGAITFLDKAFPELKNEGEQFIRDLMTRGLIPEGQWLHAMSSSFVEPHITENGLRFLIFIESPLK